MLVLSAMLFANHIETLLLPWLAGPTWQPTRIAVRSKGPAPALAHELFPDTQILTGQSEIYIAFPRSTLSLGLTPNTGDARFIRPQPPSLSLAPDELPSDFARRLRLCLEPHLFEGYPDIHVAAELLGISGRTLQRRLAELGMSYSAIVTGARFEVARRMLTQTDRTIADIGYAVGYSDPSHFARAFRRTAGVNPREYRSQVQRLSAE